MQQKRGILYLIPTSLTKSFSPKSFPENNFSVISEISEFIVEEIRTARRFLKAIGYSRDFSLVSFTELNEHSDLKLIDRYVEPLMQGKNVGLISEVGTPCIADPGAEIVALAHQKNIQVVPLIGPNSIVLALMASGLNGQSFTFHGYLPIDKYARKKAIIALENDCYAAGRTQIFIETPYRNNHLLEALLNNCSPTTRLCIASNISASDEFIKTRTIGEWRSSLPDIHKKPAVFLLNQ
jgi:16S rRNA (cytidine1402-2'-O)-methyltransferase